MWATRLSAEDCRSLSLDRNFITHLPGHAAGFWVKVFSAVAKLSPSPALPLRSGLPVVVWLCYRGRSIGSLLRVKESVYLPAMLLLLFRCRFWRLH